MFTKGIYIFIASEEILLNEGIVILCVNLVRLWCPAVCSNTSLDIAVNGIL